jgi:hypothetical protein
MKRCGSCHQLLSSGACRSRVTMPLVFLYQMSYYVGVDNYKSEKKQIVSQRACWQHMWPGFSSIWACLMSHQTTLSWKGQSNLLNYFWEAIILLPRVLFQYFLLWECLFVLFSLLSEIGILISTSPDFTDMKCYFFFLLSTLVICLPSFIASSTFFAHCVHSYSLPFLLLYP